MPEKHKYPIISFCPNMWERDIIEQRAAICPQKMESGFGTGTNEKGTSVVYRSYLVK